MPTSQFAIHDPTTYDECLEPLPLYRIVFGVDDPPIGLYPPTVHTASQHDGIMLGAFDPAGQLIGSVLGFPGRPREAERRWGTQPQEGMT